MQAKKNLARAITADFHSAAAAEAAAENWAKQFQQRGVAEDLPVVEISPSEEGLMPDGNGLRTAKLLQLAGLASSTGEANRKLGENAVSLNGEKFSEKLIPNVKAGDSLTLRLGKKSVRVVLSES
jgi:tyrosyl-tRNA synthetase